MDREHSAAVNKTETTQPRRPLADGAVSRAISKFTRDAPAPQTHSAAAENNDDALTSGPPPAASNHQMTLVEYGHRTKGDDQLGGGVMEERNAQLIDEFVAAYEREL